MLEISAIPGRKRERGNCPCLAGITGPSLYGGSDPPCSKVWKDQSLSLVSRNIIPEAGMILGLWM